MQLWWRKHSPFAAPRAIFFLSSHVRILRSLPFAFVWSMSSKLPYSMNSYTRSLSSPTLQYPRSGTRLLCLIFPKVSISAMNSLSPWQLSLTNFLIATLDPSFSVALKTSPNPPVPIRLAAENPLVASMSCENLSFLSCLWKVATLMLNGSFSLSIFHVVAA
uniref:Uncharacterized protein n=1 Tax=Opuntia streptacantha TaxID=393608 RepID=A0A7C9CS66_OPUST